MSAIGTKRTSASALHMSAFGGKADITRTRLCPLTAADLLNCFNQSRIIFIAPRGVEKSFCVSFPRPTGQFSFAKRPES